MHDDLLILDIELGEVGKDVVEHLGIAATVGVPVAGERAVPIGDARGRVHEDIGTLGPTWIADWRIADAALAQGESALYGQGQEHGRESQSEGCFGEDAGGHGKSPGRSGGVGRPAPSASAGVRTSGILFM